MTENEAKEMLQAKLTCMNLEDLSCIEKGCSHNCNGCEYNYAQCTSGEQKGALSVAIKLFEEIQQYRAIGAVDECREARERQRAKKPILQVPNNPDEMLEYHCPECGEFVCHALNIAHTKANKTNYCMVCGCKLDWSDIN